LPEPEAAAPSPARVVETPPVLQPDVISVATADDPGRTDSRSAISDSSIRVDVALLDRLMNLVGELVLSRNQIMQLMGEVENTGLYLTGQRLNHITSELQESVMKTRMQPIGNIWNKFPRVVA
jgi:two-component system chemotaxis sensor kinase CheA